MWPSGGGCRSVLNKKGYEKMKYAILSATWCAITALLLMVAIAGGATIYAFTFAATISALAAAASFGAALIIRFLGVK